MSVEMEEDIFYYLHRYGDGLRRKAQAPRDALKGCGTDRRLGDKGIRRQGDKGNFSFLIKRTRPARRNEVKKGTFWDAGRIGDKGKRRQGEFLFSEKGGDVSSKGKSNYQIIKSFKSSNIQISFRSNLQ